MITKMSSKKFAELNDRGLTIKEQSPCKQGETMPMYIPSLMAYIPKGEPRTDSATTNGNMAFVNANDCKPNPPMIVKTQNYISPKFENNATWEGVVDIENDPSAKVPTNTPVTVNFTAGCLINSTFNPN